MTESNNRSDQTTMPTLEEWQAAERVIRVALEIRDIMFGSAQPFPKSELIAAVDAFLELRENDNGQ